MVNINGKEYGLFYSIGANIAFNNWVLEHKNACFIEGEVQKLLYMMYAYNDTHGIKDEPVSKDIIMNLPNSELAAILEAVKAQEKQDTDRKVEAEPVKGKNTESVGR